MNLTRRATLALTLLPFAAAASDDALNAAIRAEIGEATPTEGGITLRVPPVAENGGQVPVTVLVDSPQSAERHVTAIHLFATRNPTPGIASFKLGPALARAEIQTRIRMAENQTLVVLARMNDGSVQRATAEIRVATGGCLT
ncbi:thiosulfate oxidation carrier protein SoxY [Roseococcus sp. SDR]|uniref:thiosulfate oxidation carrier protein SoxY n=1 Tax=Roseococcus sp. SDR TaxID=2835532 RepID=UPI001BD03DDF|nr:thiosulfate oxidation carrier protein SoxY [Roseococcus sp. SDR]MBS7792117.1 thiosulfate oxidation carrier protein SoxY [Roseococcus sp. SDR]MBV1847431.1 thiosulfate oxidation carrier protein SoxY [Roseococcus sp. SDR]